MTLKITNTFSRAKEDFIPVDPNHVRIYVCGPTVYDYAHIGNARPVVVFDVLYRLLKTTYSRVTYVRNITDIDDKIMEASRQSGEKIKSLTARFIEVFKKDMLALGSLPPDVEPLATEHIAQMVSMIENLIKKGHAYAAEHHVLFDVGSMADYGKLSGHSPEELIVGARVEVAPYKKNPTDFVLWKPSTSEQPGWKSPWGRGRPGWHLECSAMSEAHLGITFDIHGGGQDLIFPHHENEIAQSVCSHGGETFVKYWMHNGYLTVDGQKMSKSLGNFYTVNELLERTTGEAIRYSLLQAHYRQPLDFSLKAIEEAKSALDRLYNALRVSSDTKADPRQDAESVRSALEDDLNTPKALAELHRLASQLNKLPQDSMSKSALLSGGLLLGLLQQHPEMWFKGKPNEIEEAEIESLIQQRAEARAAKDFVQSDSIRDKLAAAGIILEDNAAGTNWKRG